MGQHKHIHATYVTKLYEDGANRLRPLPLPVELSRRIKELKNREVLISIHELGSIEVPLPWVIIKQMKESLLNAEEREIKEYLGFLGHDVINSFIRMILPSTPSILLRDPEKLEIQDYFIEFGEHQIKVRRIIATDFTIWPGEQVSSSIILTCELYGIPDTLDVYAHSHGRIIIKLDRLMEELGIRWDLGRR